MASILQSMVATYNLIITRGVCQWKTKSRWHLGIYYKAWLPPIISLSQGVFANGRPNLDGILELSECVYARIKRRLLRLVNKLHLIFMRDRSRLHHVLRRVGLG